MRNTLVGREKERAFASDALNRARSGDATPLLITGDAGYGKSCLVDAVIGDAAAMGFTTFVVRADEADSGVPYASMLTALAAPGAPEGDDNQRELLSLLERSVLSSPLDEIAIRSRVVEMMRRSIACWAFRGPVLVAVDDLHAADPGTAAALLYLVRHLRRDRVLLLATARRGRQDLDPATADALSRFHAGGLLDIVELGAFDHDDVAALVADRFGAAPDDALVERLENHTAGNPFFVVELINALESTNALRVDKGRLRITSETLPAMPQTVSTAVLHRVFQLGSSARSVASAASVLGHLDVRSLPLIAQLCGLDDERTEAAFDALVKSRVLTETDTGFRFVHPIVRDALYHDIGPGERSRVHWSVARHLTAERARGAGTSVVDIAIHARKANPEASSASATLFVEAGDALLLDQPRAAVEWFDDALAASPPSGVERAAIVLKRCNALDLSGHHAEAARGALEVVHVAPVGPERHDAVLVAARALTASDRLEEATDLLQGALADPVMQSSRLFLESGFVALWRQNLDEAARCLHAAERFDLGDDRPLAEVLQTRLDLERGRHREGFERAQALATHLDELPARTRRSAALGLFASAALHGDPRLVFDDFGTDAVSGLSAIPALAEWHHTYRAWCSFRTGQWDDAVAGAELAMTTEDDPSAHASVVAARAILTAVRAERGEHTRTVGQPVAAGSEPMFGYLAAWSTALDAMLAGRPADSVELLRPLCMGSHGQSSPGSRSVLLALMAEAAWSSSDVDLAVTVNRELQALPRDANGVAMTVRCLLSQSLVESDRDAAAEARSAAVANGLALEAARALQLQGTLARDADMLVASHQELGRIGALVRQRAVTHDLRKLGRRAPRQRRGGGALTAVENEIALLVAEGLSNRQIAERAMLSPKTVEVYLSRIYAKARCRSRVELAVLVNSGTLLAGVSGTNATLAVDTGAAS